MNAGDVVAVVLWIGVIAYAVFGGADFGAGFWDLVAGGGKEANGPAADDQRWRGVGGHHVWLIFSLECVDGFPPCVSLRS